MSYLDGFMGGLSDARQQRERDSRLAMDMETRRAALQDRAMEGARANERLDMERDRAIRDARNSDFDYQQKTDKAGRDQQYRQAQADIFKKYASPREEVLPDGTKKVVNPDLGDLRVQTGIFSELMQAKAQFGMVDSEELKGMHTFKRELEKDGSMKAFQQLLLGDPSGVAAKFSEYGLDPKTVKMVPFKDPKTEITTTKLVGQGKSGPFEMDMTPVMMALGLPDTDLDKGTNEKVVQSARVRTLDAQGRAALMSAQARRDRADGPGKPEFTSKDIVAEKNRAFDDIKGGISPSPRFGFMPDMVKDDPFKRKFVTGLTDELIDRSAQEGRLIAGPSARIYAEKKYEEIEDRALDLLEQDPSWKRFRSNPSKAFQMRNDAFGRVRDELAKAKVKAKDPEGRQQAIPRN